MHFFWKNIFLLIFFQITSQAELNELNFSSVVINRNFQIYRSSKLGYVGLREVFVHLRSRGIVTPKTIIYLDSVGYGGASSLMDLFLPNSFKNSNEFALEEYERQELFNFNFFHSFRYDARTYLDGYNPLIASTNIDARNYLGPKAKTIFGVIKGNAVDGGVKDFIRILDLVLDPDQQPVLFHCRDGMYRTGMIALAIRYIQEGNWMSKFDSGSNTRNQIQYENNAQIEYGYFSNNNIRKENFKFISTMKKMGVFKPYIEKYQTLLNQN